MDSHSFTKKMHRFTDNRKKITSVANLQFNELTMKLERKTRESVTSGQREKKSLDNQRF